MPAKPSPARTHNQPHATAASAGSEVYVITDIDGTLVPHPYHSGLSQSERSPYVHRLHDLIHSHHVACVTGRGEGGWRRLLHDAGVQPALPRLAGFEFGADVYYHGERLQLKSSVGEVPAVLAELRSAFAEHPEFRNQTDSSQIMSSGRLQGYYIEEKLQMAQIDWSFSSDALNLKFAELVFGVLNPHLAHNRNLKAQVFHQRIDLLEHDFIPKAALADHVLRWVRETTTSRADRHCWVFGDELYDDYLFRSIKEMVPSCFASVFCVAVANGRPMQFRYADETVDGPDDVWQLMDRLAAASATNLTKAKD
jgi:hypothetical protein